MYEQELMTPGLVWLNSKSGPCFFFFFVFFPCQSTVFVFFLRGESREIDWNFAQTQRNETQDFRPDYFNFISLFLQTARGTPLLWCLAPSQEKVEEKVRTDVAGYIYGVTENSSPMPFQFCFKFILLLGNKLGFSSPWATDGIRIRTPTGNIMQNNLFDPQAFF